MDIIEYLYKLTLDNYISNDILSDNPLFETILINFMSKNISLINSEESIHKFILLLHYELDMQFYKKPTKDIISQVKKNDKSRLRFEVKKLSLDIKKLYQSIQN